MTTPKDTVEDWESKLQQIYENCIAAPAPHTAYFQWLLPKIHELLHATEARVRKEILTKDIEEFEEKWTPPQDWIDNAEYLKRLKSFISQKLTEAREEGKATAIEEVVKVVEGMRKEGMREILIDQEHPEEGTVPSCKECGGYDECDCEGYNSALTDLLSALKDITRVV